MKQTIRLTESQLKRMITESVRQVINELDWKTYKNAAKKRWGQYGKTGDSKLYGKAGDLDKASDNAFNRDYGYDQLDTARNWYHDETVSKYNGLLGIHNYKRAGSKPALRSSIHYCPQYDNTHYSDAYWAKNASDDSEHYYTRKGLNPQDFSKQGLDALNKAREEDENYKNGNYDYVKGKGWQLKNK